MISLHQNNILLVEDSPENIDYLASALSEYRVFIAKNGEKALKIMAGKIMPDLILLDIEMPGMNGYEVCQEIRKNHLYDEIPIIFLTAKTDKESIVKAFLLGGQDYVTKPFDMNELFARIKTHLELKRSKQQLKEVNQWLEERVKDRTLDLQLALDKLKESNEELDTFIYRASHDLKGPTARILGLTNLGKTVAKDPNVIEIFNHLEGTSIHMNCVLEKLILKHIILNTVVCNAKIDLNSLIAEIEGYFKKTGTKFTLLNCSLPHLELNTDPILLKIILDNLIENAIFFNHTQKGIIIKVMAEIKNHSIVLCVEDNGDGIEDKIKGRIFDLFYRGSTKSKGSGLGLYLVKQAVGRLNGKIEVFSKVEEYTKILIHLPQESCMAPTDIKAFKNPENKMHYNLNKAGII